MNTFQKLSLMLLALSCANYGDTISKQAKLEYLMELTCNQDMLSKGSAPLFAAANIDDPAIQQQILQDYMQELIAAYLQAYDLAYTEAEIDDMIAFYCSATGAKTLANAVDMAFKAQTPYMHLMQAVMRYANPSPSDADEYEYDTCESCTDEYSCMIQDCI
jgi:hypothetical protein